MICEGGRVGVRFGREQVGRGTMQQRGRLGLNTTRTDPDLVASIAHHDNYEAWCDFVTWYAPIIRSFCISRGMRSQDTDDVVQEVFLRLSQSPIATRYNPLEGRFRSYLFQVTRSAVSAMPQRIAGAVSIELTAAQSGVDEWNQAWERACLRRVLSDVERFSSTGAKQILSLSMRGLTPAVIAETLGVSIESVYKARQRLRASIEEKLCRYRLEGIGEYED